MEKIRLMNWLVEVDVSRTKAFYQQYMECCSCLYCENYRRAWHQEDPAIIEIFSKLGIDPTKPSHLSYFEEEQDELNLYDGSYHIIGKLIEGEYCTDSDWNSPYTVTIQNFTFGFNKETGLIPDGFPQPVLQLEIENRLPWVLGEIKEE